MSDDSTFVADPDQIRAGGGATGDVGERVRLLAENYVTETRWDPQDSPFGADAGGREFAASIGAEHERIAEGIRALHYALSGFADVTVDAGKSFGTAQDDAKKSISDLHGTGGRR
ncbi:MULTISPECIES: hypothetical protein [Streptomyces]|uniref:hypothetical protein n=1 Tax=Streptomyces TaxID=1883 RepID=UPI0023DD4A23|nr:hypothetical protein [Streptomyces sp. FXJ1.172]WEP00907.1 hypothetical protein A6P39_042865 [Streptomyces sp. FXJ1.172]